MKGNELDWSPDTLIITSIGSPRECRYINGHISTRERIGFVSHFFPIQKERERETERERKKTERERKKTEREMRGRKKKYSERKLCERDSQ